MSGIAVEATDQSLTIGGRRFREFVDEGFDLLSAGITQSRDIAKIGGKGLHEARIEPILADQQAELIAEAKLAAVVAVV